MGWGDRLGCAQGITRVLRTLSFALVASFALAGCATSTAPYSLPTPTGSAGTYRPPPGPNHFTTAARGPVHSELFACNGGGGSNVGEIGYRGEVVLYSPYIDTPAGALLRLPVERACLSSGFGWRSSMGGNGRQHNGVDLANTNGGYIYAAGDGRVVRADYRGGYGNTLELDHGHGVHTLYAHLFEIDGNLQPGSRVTAGQPVARMGSTGNATGVHLHYEVWVDGLLVDPLNYGRPPVYVSHPQAEPLPLPDEADEEDVEYEEDEAYVQEKPAY